MYPYPEILCLVTVVMATSAEYLRYAGYRPLKVLDDSGQLGYPLPKYPGVVRGAPREKVLNTPGNEDTDGREYSIFTGYAGINCRQQHCRLPWLSTPDYTLLSILPFARQGAGLVRE